MEVPITQLVEAKNKIIFPINWRVLKLILSVFTGKLESSESLVGSKSTEALFFPKYKRSTSFG